MQYFTKNFNMLLFFLVILATTVNVVAAVYYHSTYGGIEEEQNENAKTLNTCQNNLKDKEFRLNELSARLNTQQSRESEFADQFVEVREGAESLEQEVTRLRTDKQILQSRIGVVEKELEEQKSKVSVQTEDIASLFRQNKKLKDDLNDCEDEN